MKILAKHLSSPARVRRSRRLLPALLLISGALTLPWAAARLIESRVASRLAALGLRADVAVEPFSGRAQLTGLSGRLGPAGAFRIGEASFPTGAGLIPQALAAQDITLKDISAATAGVSFGAPLIRIAGSNLDESGLKLIFDPADPRPAAERLAEVRASEVTIPEFTLAERSRRQTATFIYRDTRLSGVADGLIAEASGGSGLFEITHPDHGDAKGRFGQIKARRVDIALLARFYAGASVPDTPMRTAYEFVSVENVTLRDALGFELSLDRAALKDYRLRPTNRPWLDIAAALDDELDFETPEGRAKQFNALADIMGLFQVGAVELSGIDIRLFDPAPPGSVRVARAGFAERAEGIDLEFEDIAVAFADRKVKIGQITLNDWSLAPSVQGLRETLGNPDIEFDDIDFRALTPRVGHFGLRDLATDIPDRSAMAQDQTGPDVPISVRAIDITGSNRRNGLPTAYRVSFDTLAMTLPPEPRNELSQNFVSLGYLAPALSFAMDFRWDEQDSALFMNELMISGVEMGRAAAAAEFGHVTSAAFGADLEQARLAWLGATLRSFSLTIDNHGLIDRLAERDAKKQDKTPERLRKEWSAAASVLVPAMLGGSDGARAIGTAVAKFLAKPISLTITTKAKDPLGVGLSDYMAAGSPQDLLGMMDIAATAH